VSVLIYSRHPALTPSHQATLARPAVDAIRTTKPFIRTRFAASDAARMGSSGTVPRLRSGGRRIGVALKRASAAFRNGSGEASACASTRRIVIAATTLCM